MVSSLREPEAGTAVALSVPAAELAARVEDSFSNSASALTPSTAAAKHSWASSNKSNIPCLLHLLKLLTLAFCLPPVLLFILFCTSDVRYQWYALQTLLKPGCYSDPDSLIFCIRISVPFTP